MSSGGTDLTDFAVRYTAAWCGGDPARVAAFFSPGGSLRVNDAPPAVGREAIAAVALSFMTAFPDLRVEMDELRGYVRSVLQKGKWVMLDLSAFTWR